MSASPLPSEMRHFYRIVKILRALPPRYQHLALFAAEFWSDEQIEQAAINGDLPGQPGALAEPKAPVLKLVVSSERDAGQ